MRPDVNLLGFNTKVLTYRLSRYYKLKVSDVCELQTRVRSEVCIRFSGDKQLSIGKTSARADEIFPKFFTSM